MSTELRDGIPALPDAPPGAHPGAVIKGLVNRGERIAWSVAAVLALGWATSEAWPRLFPAPPAEVYVPVYINEFGQKKLPTELAAQTLTPEQASARADLNDWVEAYGRYSYDFLPLDFKRITCMSPDGVFRQYRSQFYDRDIEAFIDVEAVKDKVARHARAVDISLLGPNESGGFNARVTMERRTVYKERPADQQPQPQYFVLTLQYRHDPRLKLSPECRVVNRAGFMVTSARVDQQLQAPPSVVAKPAGSGA